MVKYKFDEVVSLGHNCEVSFRIKDLYGHINSYPFSWANICDRKLFLKSIDNLDNILSGDITLLPWGMFKCEKYDINFHASKKKDHLFINGKPNEEDVKVEIANLKNKTKHLVNKFKNLLESDRNTLFVLKIQHDNNSIDIKFSKELDDIKFIKELYAKLLKSYKSQKFVLLVVLEKKYLNSKITSLESEHLKIRGIKKFAKHNETEISGDISGWYNIFNEFKIAHKLRFFIMTKIIIKRMKKNIKKCVNAFVPKFSV